ncbi:MAG: hypothetical protein D6711_10735, partial [Chloroflexi bacterium]
MKKLIKIIATVCCVMFFTSAAFSQATGIYVLYVHDDSNPYTTTVLLNDRFSNIDAVDLSVGDTLYQYFDDQLHLWYISSVLAINNKTAQVDLSYAGAPAIKPLVQLSALIKSGSKYSYIPGIDPDLQGALAARFEGGGGNATTSVGGIIPYFTLQSHSSLYSDHPDYPKYPGQSDNSLETSIDVSDYLQQVIDSAATVGGTVLLGPGWYKVTKTINVPEGVTIEGVSAGKFGVYATPYQDWWDSGTVISFEPSQDNLACFRFYSKDPNGREVRIGGIKNVTIMGDNLRTGSKAIHLDATPGFLTSGHFEDVHIHGFRNGVGLLLEADSTGAVTYNTFENLRFRDADTSIALIARGNISSFINSNLFYNTVISGGNLDYGILAMTTVNDINVDCNHNQFYGGSVEPQYTKYGHIVVKGNAWIVTRQLRVEATQQFLYYPDTRPIYLDSTTTENDIEVFGSIEIDDRGYGNVLKTRSPKNSYPNTSSQNMLSNSTFAGLTIGDSSRYEMKDWQIGTADFSSSTYTLNTGDTIPIVRVLDDSIPPEYNVLRITIPPGKKLRFVPSPFDSWKYNRGRKFTVGAWVKSTGKNAAQWIYTSNSDNGTITVGTEFPYQTNKWTWVGCTFDNYASNTLFLCYLTVFNDTTLNGNAPLDVYIASPTFVWGNEVSYHLGGYLEKSGGSMSGPLSLSQAMNININDTEYIDTSGNTTRLYLPTSANFFALKSPGVPRTITSINVAEGTQANNPYAKVFKGGTEITLMFLDSNININSSSYIHLLGDQ